MGQVKKYRTLFSIAPIAATAGVDGGGSISGLIGYSSGETGRALIARLVERLGVQD